MTAFFARRGWHAATLTNVLLCVLGAGLVWCSHQLVNEFQSYWIGYSGVAAWSLALYVAAMMVVLALPGDRYTLPLIVAVGVVCQAIPLMVEPAMSSDIYRYAWDGVVQHAHVNPYRYVPGDAALRFLQVPNQDLFDSINRRDYAHTIYPPAAQMFFYAVTWMNGSMLFMKLCMVLLEGLTLWGLLQLLKDVGLPRERALLFAWCPLLIWEIGSSGHIDSLLIALMTLTLLCRLKGKAGWCGFFFALCVLTKFFPVVLFPALFQRRAWRMPVVAVLTGAACYACYLSVGRGVLGFLTSGYASEEGLQTGSRYFLMEAMRRLPGTGWISNGEFQGVMLLVLGALAVWAWRVGDGGGESRWMSGLLRTLRLPGRAAFLVPSAVLVTVSMLIFSPHYPWYLCCLVPFFTLMPLLPLPVYFGGLFYLCTTIYGAGTVEAQYAMNRILYSLVGAAAVVDAAGRALSLRLAGRRARA